MFKVMTLNINHYGQKHGGWEARKRLIADTIEKAAPDVVALQAVGKHPQRHDGQDQASQLADVLPAYEEVIFREATELPDGCTMGPAFLARERVAESGSLRLSRRPGIEDAHQRMVLKAGFDIPGGVLHIFNAHFSWVYAQALDNCEETIAYANARSGLALLTGDLNTTPERGLLRRLKQEGWVDVWAALRPGESGWTFESEDPRQRIDYVFANRNLCKRLQAVELLGVGLDVPPRLSDHLGLMVTLSLP